MAEIIGSAAIEIKAKDKNFENEVRKIAGKIKKVEVPVDAVVNTDLAKKQLEAFRKSQQGRKVKLYAEVDTKSAATTLNKFIKSYQSKNVKLSVDVDTESVLEAATLLDDFKEQYHDKTIDVAVDVDESLGDDLDNIRNSASKLENALNKDLRLNVDSAGANAQLLTTAALAQATRRAITSPMRMNIDKQTLDGIKGFFYTLTGSIPIDKVKTVLTGLAANFESISVKSGIVSSSVLALAGTLSHAVGDLLTIGGDVTQVVGLLNAAPAGLAAGGLALTGTILGWKGFGQALMGEGKEAAEAMKLLPPEAQKAVKALDGVGSSIRRTTQARYWKGMGTAVQDVMRAIRKDLDVGMGNAGEALGGQMSAIFGAMQEFGESGGLSNTFRDLTEFFKTSTPALAGFTSGFLDLMEGGAREMPAFGSWLSELGTSFSNWAKEANETGTINIWIQEASQRMKELGKVAQATYGMFSGLTSAARNAGMNGLTELASGMVDVSNAMNEPAFQAGLTSFFSSVRVGAANALPGVGNFFKMMGEGLPTINKAIETSGTVTGNMFNNFTRMFENGNLGKGFLELLNGMSDATKSLEPGFESLGNALGGAMEVAGEVVRNVAPGLNQLFETIDIVINNMKDGMISAMPVFNEFIQGLLSGIKSVLDPLSSVVGGILSAFAGLPSGIQTALMSVGAVLGSRAWLQSKLDDNKSAVGNFTRSVGNSFSGMTTSVASSVGVMRTSLTRFNASVSDQMIGPLTQAQAQSQTLTQRMVQSNGSAAQRITKIWADNSAKQQAIWKRSNQVANELRAATTIQSGIGGQILPSTGRGSIEAVSSRVSAVSSSVKSTLGSVGKTASVVGGQISRGLGTAIGGLTGALGGPWGLAITGAIAGLTLLGQASADQKQRIEDLKQTLTESGDASSATVQNFAERFEKDNGSVFDKVASFLNGKGFAQADVSSQIQSTGKSVQDFSRDLVKFANDGENSVETWKKVRGMARQGLNGEQVTQSLREAGVEVESLGLDLTNLDAPGLENVSNAAVKMIKDFDTARRSTKDLAKDFRDNLSLQVMDNANTLTNPLTSVEEKLAAFKSNLKIGGLEQISSQQGFYQLGQVTEQNTSKLQTMNNVMKESGKSLSSAFDIKTVGEQSVAMFEMNTQAGRQMYEVVGSQADAIHSAMISSYDTALKNSGDVEKATSEAMKTAKADIASFTTELKNAGISDSDIATILDTAGLSGTDITMALKTQGIDEAISGAMQVEAAMQGLKTGDWSMTIDVMADEAKATIADTLGLAEDASAQEITTKLRAQFDNQDEYQSWMTEFGKSIPEQRAKMVAELVNGEQAKSAIDAISSTGGELDGQTWRSQIQVTADEAKASANDVYSAINLIPEKTLAKITADVEGDPAAELDAVLGSKEFKAKLKAVLDGDPEAELDSKLPKEKKVPVKAEMTGNLESELNLAAGDGVRVPVTPDVKNMPSIASMFGGAGGASEVLITTKFAPPTNPPDVTVPDVTINTTANTAGADQVKSTVDSITDKNVSVTVTANESNLNSIRDTMNSLTNKTVSVNVQANETNLNAIKSSMDALTNKNVSVNVTANESNLNSIRNTMNSLTNKSVSVTVKANSGGIQQIQSAMSSLTNKSVSVNIKANTGPINAIRAVMASIVNKNVTVAVNANTGPVNALRAVINSIVNKTVTITANAPTAAVNALRTAIATIKSKTVSILANTNVGAVYAMRAAIASVQSKTVTVTTRTRTIGENANGGVYMGGVRTFARGGFDDPRIAKAIERAQRRSGPENHQAQIARGSNNYRVWGEPETGGEAYIPLALSKRLRSLKILEQVASHFGVSLSQYADGGLIGGNKVSSNVTTFASGGTTKATKASAKAKEAEKKRKSDLKELNKTIKESIRDLKKALSDGLSDLKSEFGKADRTPVQKALDGMRKGVRDFRSDTTKQIKEAKKLGKSTKTMSAQLKASSKVDKAITKQMYSSKVWDRKGNNLKDSQYIANDAQRRQKDRRVDYNSKFTLRDYERSIDYINEELEKQQDKYDNMVKNHRSNMESISGNLFKQFDIGSLVNNKDEFGYRPPTTARDISSYASKLLSDMRTLSSNLGKLRKAGYNEAIINQISQMGLEEALVVSQALLSDKSQMKSINKSYTEMFGKRGDMYVDPKTGELGFDPKSLAAKIGKTGADAMFKAGNDIQKGLVNGLTADVKALEKAGQAMSDALTKSFRKALKIQSPSRVFRDLAKYIPQGVVQGIDSGRGSVDSSISGLVQPKRLNLTAPGSRTANSSGIINGNGGTNPVTVNVYPSEGMSERQIGTTAAREIHYRLDAGL